MRPQITTFLQFGSFSPAAKHARHLDHLPLQGNLCQLLRYLTYGVNCVMIQSHQVLNAFLTSFLQIKPIIEHQTLSSPSSHHDVKPAY